MRDIPVELISCMVILMLLAALAAVLLKKIKFPFTIGLVILGVALGMSTQYISFLKPMQSVHLTPNIILYILLPTLVYEAAVNIDTRTLLKNLIPVLILAAPGLILATAVTGLLMNWLTPLTLGAAMLFGALISATDPVAVIAVFKELGAPKRLTMLVDGESLFNDATAIVMFDIVLAMLVSGVSMSAATAVSAAGHFVLVFAGGGLLGALIGFVIVQFFSLAKNDPLIEIALTTVVAYAAFILAQFYLELSGVMAVVGAGLVVSYYATTRFTPTVQEYTKQFWEFMAFAANSFIFLMLGLTEDYLTRDVQHVAYILLYVGVAVLAVLVARMLVVFGLVPLVNKLTRHHPIRIPYQSIMFWGGLRGALPIGLAMSLTAAQVGGEENRMLILDCTLGVVLFTLLVQGTTISRLMNWFKLNELSPLDLQEQSQATLAVKREGLKAVKAMGNEWPVVATGLMKKIEADYSAEVEALASKENEKIPVGVARSVMWLQTLGIANRSLRRMYECDFVNESILRELEQTIELCCEDVKHGVYPPNAHLREAPEQRFNAFLYYAAQKMNLTQLAARYQKRAVDLSYSTELAVAEMCQSVQKQLDRITELSGIEGPEKVECAVYFQELITAALTRIRSLSDEHKDLVVQLQERAIRRYALLVEGSVVQELRANSGVSEKIGMLIDEQIAQQMQALSRFEREETDGGDAS